MTEKEIEELKCFYSTMDDWPELIKIRASNPVGSYDLIFELKEVVQTSTDHAPLD